MMKKGRGEAAFVLALIAFLLVAGLYMFPDYKAFVTVNWDDMGFDFFNFYSSASGMNKNISDIYNSQQIIDFKTKICGGRWQVSQGDTHPPQFYLLYDFFTLFPFKTAYIIHFAISIVLYTFSLMLLTVFLLGKKPLSYIVALLLSLYSVICSVCVDNIFLGQVGFILVFLLILTYYCGEKGQWIPAGFFLSLAILFKMFPFLLIFYYIFRKQYRVVISCFASLALLTVVTGFMWGFQRYFQYMDWMNELNRKIYFSNIKDQYFANHSIMGYISTVTADMLPIMLLKSIHLSIIAFSVFFLYLLHRKIQADDRTASSLEYSLYVLSSTFLAPFSFSHHHIVLIIPFIALIVLFLKGGHQPRLRMLLIASLALFALFWIFDGQLLTRQWILALHFDFSNRCMPLVVMLVMAFFTAVTLLWSSGTQGPANQHAGGGESS